jgi:hypothetical protein
MSYLNVTDIILCLFCAFTIYWLLRTNIKMLRFALYGKRLDSKEVPWDSVAMMPELEERDAQIRAQGFTPMVLFEVFFYPMSKTGHTWTYINEEGTIWVQTAQDTHMTQYTSLFSDDSMVITRTPFGENIDTLMYHSRFSKRDLDAAYQYHVKKVKEWEAEHGSFYRVRVREDLEHHEAIYRQKHRALDFRSLTIELGIQMAVGFLAIGLLLMQATLIAFFPRQVAAGGVTDFTFWIALSLGALSIFIPTWGHQYRFRAANAIDNRKEKPKNDFEY